ncbi:hypothetical protein [Agrilactobacillus composti]|uniref:hypothetical protein n=1 Tax=Agrilactobacillus composti TaxID=398555 RepID=UPI000AB2FB70|nr:hypothetical protein [Agrilactobacillus composti]
MSRYKDHSKAIKTLQGIENNPEKHLIIHYACESFYDKTDGSSPRITSIAVKKFDDEQPVYKVLFWAANLLLGGIVGVLIGRFL